MDETGVRNPMARLGCSRTRRLDLVGCIGMRVVRSRARKDGVLRHRLDVDGTVMYHVRPLLKGSTSLAIHLPS